MKVSITESDSTLHLIIFHSHVYFIIHKSLFWYSLLIEISYTLAEIISKFIFFLSIWTNHSWW